MRTEIRERILIPIVVHNNEMLQLQISQFGKCKYGRAETEAVSKILRHTHTHLNTRTHTDRDSTMRSKIRLRTCSE